MALNTKHIDPATISGFVRGRLETYDENDALQAILPNIYEPAISVRFAVGEHGVTPMAELRDWDAQPDMLDLPAQKRRTIDLVAASSRIPITESDALLANLSGGEGYLNLIYRAGDACAQSIYNRVKFLRAKVLATGKATVDQENFGLDEDFGRSTELTAEMSTLVTESTTDPIVELQDFVQIIEDKGGARPDIAFASTKAINAFLRHPAFASRNIEGFSRPATLGEVNDVLVSNDLPSLRRYNEKVAGQRLLPEDRLIFAPTNNPDVGSTVWGLTESVNKPEFGGISATMPGAVAAVWTTDGTAGKTVVDADATVLPILKNADLTASLKVV